MNRHNAKRKRDHSTTPQRRGAILVAALVCLLIVTSMLGAMLQSALRAHRQMRKERDLRQAELLLQAGVQRAARQRQNDTNERGDTWQLASEEITGHGAGLVVVEPVQQLQQQMWRVRAEYPLGKSLSARRSQFLAIRPNEPQHEE